MFLVLQGKDGGFQLSDLKRPEMNKCGKAFQTIQSLLHNGISTRSKLTLHCESLDIVDEEDAIINLCQTHNRFWYF